MATELTLLLVGDAPLHAARAAVAGTSEGRFQESEVLHFDGSMHETLIAFSAAASSCALLVRSIRPFVTAKRVRIIKLGDLEITNPRDSDVDRVLEILEESPNLLDES